MDEGVVSEIIAMAWADDVSFDAIERLHGLSEKQVKSLMRAHLKPSSYRLWRKRVTGRKAKHEGRRKIDPEEISEA
jgi:uncharacterized protein (TIGR03643 family)